MDIVSPETRSRMMSGIRGKNTKPEKLIRKLLFASGYRFRLHRKDLPGAPDIVLPGRKVAVFVHGCFWHRHEKCSLTKLPASNAEFWRLKLDRNVQRDRQAVLSLNAQGWRVLIVWECAMRNGGPDFQMLQRKLDNWIKGSGPLGEIAAL